MDNILFFDSPVWIWCFFSLSRPSYINFKAISQNTFPFHLLKNRFPNEKLKSLYMLLLCLLLDKFMNLNCMYVLVVFFLELFSFVAQAILDIFNFPLILYIFSARIVAAFNVIGTFNEKKMKCKKVTHIAHKNREKCRISGKQCVTTHFPREKKKQLKIVCNYQDKQNSFSIIAKEFHKWDEKITQIPTNSLDKNYEKKMKSVRHIDNVAYILLKRKLAKVFLHYFYFLCFFVAFQYFSLHSVASCMSFNQIGIIF